MFAEFPTAGLGPLGLDVDAVGNIYVGPRRVPNSLRGAQLSCNRRSTPIGSRQTSMNGVITSLGAEPAGDSPDVRRGEAGIEHHHPATIATERGAGLRRGSRRLSFVRDTQATPPEGRDGRPRRRTWRNAVVSGPLVAAIGLLLIGCIGSVVRADQVAVGMGLPGWFAAPGPSRRVSRDALEPSDRLVNDAAGGMWRQRGRPVMAFELTVREGKMIRKDLIADPDLLGRVLADR